MVIGKAGIYMVFLCLSVTLTVLMKKSNHIDVMFHAKAPQASAELFKLLINSSISAFLFNVIPHKPSLTGQLVGEDKPKISWSSGTDEIGLCPFSLSFFWHGLM